MENICSLMSSIVCVNKENGVGNLEVDNENYFFQFGLISMDDLKSLKTLV